MQPSQRLYIHLPEKYEDFKKSGEWDHGIVITDLNPLVTQGELHDYFEKFGTITECVFTIDKSSGWPKGVGFVRYSSSAEAKAAEKAGPHCLGGFPLRINRVITEKLNTPPCQAFQTDCV
ncbi:heterogeneous nuclear ribonucleoprotein A0 [Carassius carassius]|uniref:heterogeneous nuclear ribonucleoprotein A0 n=1 Tax=Carassius carassius TaxID=217509 RepID=UPI002869129D|nr:heterogeneous nuclear ribonucleoprotein A0 [Carassius carassius]